MAHDAIQFHNVAERRDRPQQGGQLLQRVPESVRQDLNEGAQRRMRHPAGVELRFVPSGTVEVTLSSTGPGECPVSVFWGPFQERETYTVGTEPTTIEVSQPDRLADIDDDVIEGLAFDPAVCRIRLPGDHRGEPMLYHGVEGERRPPVDDELPDRRYLAYGTSITEGEAPSAEHLSYVSQTAWRLDADLVNLGSCGTAYCDPAMAEHIATRDDWDVATLALSINMVGTFSPTEFRERATNMIETVADANPDTPVVAITIYRNDADVRSTVSNDCETFRGILREIVERTPHDNVTLLEGTEILPSVDGLTPDLVHPGDNAMIRMGETLADRLEDVIDPQQR